MQVVLEPLPPAVQAALEQHNSHALWLFVNYVRCYVGSMGPQLPRERALPLSGVSLPVRPASASGDALPHQSAAIPCPTVMTCRCCTSGGPSHAPALRAGGATSALWDSGAQAAAGQGSLSELLEAQRVEYQVGAGAWLAATWWAWGCMALGA